MKVVRGDFVAHVFDDYGEYSRVVSNSRLLANIVESIIGRYLEGEEVVVEVVECGFRDHHFRYYVLLCYDCHLEEKKNKWACVKYPIASCTIIEALSEDEEHVDEVRIIGRFHEPAGREWVDFEDIMQRAVARIYNRVFTLRIKRVCD